MDMQLESGVLADGGAGASPVCGAGKAPPLRQAAPHAQALCLAHPVFIAAGGTAASAPCTRYPGKRSREQKADDGGTRASWSAEPSPGAEPRGALSIDDALMQLALKAMADTAAIMGDPPLPASAGDGMSGGASASTG